MTAFNAASLLRWKVAFPAFLVLALAAWGMFERSLTLFQVLSLGPIMYGVIVCTVGAFAYRAKPRVDQEPIPEDEWPMVSIMIPAHNEQFVIGSTVESMLRLDYPRFEVIVIDDHSSDETGTILRNYPIKVVTRRNLPNRGKSEALNAGIEVASGDIICIFDADTMVAPNYLRLAVAPMVNNPEICGVQTQVRMYNRRQNFLTAAQDEEFAIFNELQQMGRYVMGGAAALGGNGQLTRRSSIKAVGGWSPLSLTEDLDLTIRLFLAGRGRIAHCSEAIVWQEGVSTVKALVRQRTRWAEGMLRCFGEYAGQVLRSPEMSWGLRVDTIYALASVYLPLVSLLGFLYAVFSNVPDFFVHTLPRSAGDALTATTFFSLCAWSAVITAKRDRIPNPLFGLRFMVYILHWLPAMMAAMRNVLKDQPVVWEKTEHRGHLISSTLAPGIAAVGSGREG